VRCDRPPETAGPSHRNVYGAIHAVRTPTAPWPHGTSTTMSRPSSSASPPTAPCARSACPEGATRAAHRTVGTPSGSSSKTRPPSTASGFDPRYGRSGNGERTARPRRVLPSSHHFRDPRSDRASDHRQARTPRRMTRTNANRVQHWRLACGRLARRVAIVAVC